MLNVPEVSKQKRKAKCVMDHRIFSLTYKTETLVQNKIQIFSRMTISVFILS